jgi:SAM-dependent methyltransferase
MLAKAKAKNGGGCVKWDVQDAKSLSYTNGSFDAVFMSHLLHHVDEPSAVIEECRRILRPGGTILNRYGALDHIRDDPEHTFFPETLEIDEARIPSIEQVEVWFRASGFKDVSSTTVEQQTDASAEGRLERVSLQSTSALTLISRAAFERGLEAMRSYISENPDDPWLLMDNLTLTTGRK